MKKRLLSLFRARPKEVASVVASPAGLPSSGLTVVDNSQGASAATAEFSEVLGEALGHIDLDGDLESQFRQIIDDLDQEASKYANSQLNPEAVADWNCSKPEAQLIKIACECAVGTYSLSEELRETPDYRFHRNHIILPEMGGSIKATALTIVEPTANSAGNGSFLPALVVAIRGSASKMDHVVNINGEPRDASHFINSHGAAASMVQAHTGFLNSAEDIFSLIDSRVREYLDKCWPREGHVIFTGHSAGGAVASLLFLRYKLQPHSSNLGRFSCITFGAPPSVSCSLQHELPAEGTMTVDIINELDPVTRADKSYILSLVNIIRSMNGQGLYSAKLPKAGPASNDDNSTPNEAQPPSLSRRGNDLAVFPMPIPVFHHVNPKVVLYMRLDGDQIRLKAAQVTDEAFRQLLFCRPSTHRKTEYFNRSKMVEAGTFNDFPSWKLE